MYQNKTFLITGIADEYSLAAYTAKLLQQNGANIVCAGLGLTPYHSNLSDKAKAFLQASSNAFQQSVSKVLGDSTPCYILDVTQPESIADMANDLASNNVKLHGWLHAIAMDRTIRKKSVKPLIDVTKEEFFDTMEVSAYSLISVTRELLNHGVLQAESSIVSLSYIAAKCITYHPYKNIAIAKCALERITKELAYELGSAKKIRVNCIRFSPYMGSKAGTATLSQEDFDVSDNKSPLGNATPEDLAREIVHLFHPENRITGEIRHVDGGYHILG